MGLLVLRWQVQQPLRYPSSIQGPGMERAESGHGIETIPNKQFRKLLNHLWICLVEALLHSTHSFFNLEGWVVL